MSRPLPVTVTEATGGDREAVRAHIVDAALRVIDRDGLSGASTRAIAAEAGLAGGTMYNYFGGRSDLLAAAIVRRTESAAEPVTDFAQHAGSRTILDNLRIFMDQAAAVLDDLVPLIAASFAEPELLARLRRRVSSSPALADPTAGLLQYLVAERALGRIRADTDVAAVSGILGSMCHDDAFRRHLFATGPSSRTRELAFLAESLELPDRKEI